MGQGLKLNLLTQILQFNKVSEWMTVNHPLFVAAVTKLL